MASDHFHHAYWLLNEEGRMTVLFLTVIVTLVFLLTYLFFRYIYLHAYPPVYPTTALILARSEIELPCVSLGGLAPAIIRSLPFFISRIAEISDDCDLHNTSSSSSFMDGECCICLGIYEDEAFVKVMPRCLHAFHCKCVDEWEYQDYLPCLQIRH